MKNTLSCLSEIDLGLVEELLKVGVDINGLFLLTHTELLPPSIPKVKIWMQTLIRKGFITESGQLTNTGKELLQKLEVGNFKATSLTKVDESDAFERWWKAFPSNDTFEYGGVRFSGTRGLKTEKAKCKQMLNGILRGGVYTIEDLLLALETEIEQKKAESLKRGRNQMSFFKNSAAYLNQGAYEGLIGLKPTKQRPKFSL